MTEGVQPQEIDSGLVERTWTRASPSGGELSERPLEGKQVADRFIDPHGQLQHATGTVCRNGAGELVIESWADGLRQETAVPRDASVDVTGVT